MAANDQLYSWFGYALPEDEGTPLDSFDELELLGLYRLLEPAPDIPPPVIPPIVLPPTIVVVQGPGGATNASATLIANMALSRVGVTQQIANLFEKSKEARVCNLWYNPCRDQLLTEMSWGFATSRRVLAEVDTPPQPWGHAYRYPTDCLLAREIDMGTILYGSECRIPFEVIEDGSGGKLIYTDQDQAALLFNKAIQDEKLFTPQFIDALAWRLAVEVAMPLTVNVQIRDSCQQNYLRAIAQARTAELFEQQDRPQPDSEFIRART